MEVAAVEPAAVEVAAVEVAADEVAAMEIAAVEVAAMAIAAVELAAVEVAAVEVAAVEAAAVEVQHSTAHVGRNLVPYFGLLWHAGKRQHKSQSCSCTPHTMSLVLSLLCCGPLGTVLAMFLSFGCCPCGVAVSFGRCLSLSLPNFRELGATLV